jgi:tetratricopeptide (TPR) repeat protein
MMKRIYLVVAFSLVASAMLAQSRTAAKKLFEAGNYAEAKPMFGKLLADSPKNGEYNYWYAVCCVETGDTVDVGDMLEFAATRKITNAYRYLGDYHFGKMNFPRASECYDAFLEKNKDDSLRVVFSKRAVKARNVARMVMNADRICVIDSFVVDKNDFLSAYRIGDDAGLIEKSSVYFDDDGLQGFVNETGRGLDIFFSDLESEDDGALMKLYHNTKVGDEWGSAKRIEGFDTYGNDNYPFMGSDGVTLYFASDGEGSIGGYDIFMSRMDLDDGSFLRPDNVGMPFNSTANDYMLVFNEVEGLGWFASDRNQPEGYVCVYLFIMPEGVEKYDSEEIGYERMLHYASISSIADTQTDAEAVRKARQRYAMLLYMQAEEADNGDFLYVIDDTRDYTVLSDFKSRKARDMFADWQVRTKRLESDIKSLDELRDAYSSAGNAEKRRMSQSILSLEDKVERELTELERLELEIRRVEQQELYK